MKNKVSGCNHTKEQMNDYSNQCNPNNNAHKSNMNNHANQCNPNNKEHKSNKK